MGFVGLSNSVKDGSKGKLDQWYVGIKKKNKEGDVFAFGFTKENGNGQQLEGPPTGSCTDGQWCHIAVTVNQTRTAKRTDVTFFINGNDTVVDDDNILVAPAADQGPLGLFIGANPPSDETPPPTVLENKFVFDGLIDEVGVYDSILDKGVIKFFAETKCAGTAPTPPGGKSSKGPKGSSKASKALKARNF